MRFVRIETSCGKDWGIHDGDSVHTLSDLDVGSPTLESFSDPEFRAKLGNQKQSGALDRIATTDVDFLAPVETPGKIVGVGLNYYDHAEEQDADVPDRPLLFGKAPTAVTNPGSPIVHPAGIEQLDYEVELGIVIGERAKNVTRENATDYLAGFTVVNDVSARDAQFQDTQWFRGKSYDTFAPMGPALVTPNDLDSDELGLELRVNGNVKQASSTAELIFGVDELLKYVSAIMTLEPGDVIATGTPGGVGVFRNPPDLLEPGDVVEAEIDGIGVLENTVVAEST